MSENPLLRKTFAVPFDAIRAEHVEPAIDSLLAEARRDIDALIGGSGHRTYDNTLGALERATDTLEWAAGVVAHLESVATYPELRAAHEAIQPKLSTFWSSVVLDEGLWKALTEFADTDEARGLTGVHARYLQKTLDEFRREGAELDAAGKARIAEINVTLAERTTKFTQNVLDATNAFELIITNEEQLAGLPATARELARESAVAKGKEGWRFTLQAPSVIPVLTYLDDARIREHIWRANMNRAADERADNRALIAEILQLRREKASILGYPDFADLVLEDRMAGSGAKAMGFVDDLRARTDAFFAQEREALCDFARSTTGDPDASVHPWDIEYYAEKQRSALFDFDEEDLRPYFPAAQVMNGLFDILSRLYSIRIEPTADLPKWDDAVQTFRVVDADGTHRASFYVDLYPRETKRGGAWMNHLQVGGPDEPHLGLICGNMNPPVGGKPALLTHREVETIFHEMGHLMHLCLSEVPVRALSGVNVAWDFVELPSQIMENWCWERDALDVFARHYETGDPIPETLFAKMQAARTYRAGTAQMRQLGYATLDLKLHREFNGDTDLHDYTRAVVQRHYPATLPSPYWFVAAFTHLFGGPVGYAAGYYSYKWSEVLDADAFSRFKAAGVFASDVGRAFREHILAKGDSEPPMELYKAFMGREPKLDALLERQGLVIQS